MRKFLVKNFVLDYFFTLFGKKYNTPRASRILYPLTVLTGIVHTYFESTLSWSLIILLIVAYYIGFAYFHSFPVKWEELDDLQKIQYGRLQELTEEQRLEWLELIQKQTYEIKKLDN